MKLVFCYLTILIFFVIFVFSTKIIHAAPTSVSQMDESELLRKMSKLLDARDERNLENIKGLLCSMKIRCDHSEVKWYQMGLHHTCPKYELFLDSVDCN
jgi:hypothetical protein